MNSSVNATYSLYGANIKNGSVREESLMKLSIDGHIYVDITSPKPDFIIKPFNVSDVELVWFTL